MTKTSNYKLNQWEKQDRVLMEDFNADNAKIEAALTALAEKPGITPLGTFTVDRQHTGAQTFTMDVSGIDWAAWHYIYMDFDLKGSGYVLLYPNGDPADATSQGLVTSNDHDSLAGMIEMSPAGFLSRVTFQIYRHGDRLLRAVTDSIRGRSKKCTWSALKTLDLRLYNESYTLDAGSTITLYGVK